MTRRPLQRRNRVRRAAAALGSSVAVMLGLMVTWSGPAHAENEPGSWSQRSIADMTVELYEPATAPAHPGGRALMISLHGCVQTSQDLRTGGNWAPAADDHGMVVAVPAAPNGGVLLGCWDYYDTNHDRENPSRHDDNLLDLVDTLLADEFLGIDPDQVYISGLSSGGGQAMVMGCLAPDVFAGVGLNAGPTVGTTAAEIGSVATTLEEGRAVCAEFADDHADAFDTQVTSVVYGSADTTVARGYNPLNASIMADLYSAGATSEFPLDDLPGSNTNGSGTLHSDADGPRVSLIENTGVGHAWPAGSGPGGSYISTDSIDYPAYVTSFFFDSNRRIDGDDPGGPGDDVTPPEVSITAPADGDIVSGTVQVAADASDDTAVDRVEVTVDGEPIGTARSGPYEVTWNTSESDPGERELVAEAYDTAGNAATAAINVVVERGAEDGCATATNAQHESAGRAMSYGVDPYNPYYALGSNDYLGQGDATVTSLQETSPDQYSLVPSC